MEKRKDESQTEYEARMKESEEKRAAGQTRPDGEDEETTPTPA